MISYIDSNELKDAAFLLINNGIVVDAGNSILYMTGYTKEDFLGKKIFFILYDLLKSNINIQDKAEDLAEREYILFTKTYQFREVTVTKNTLNETDMLIVFTENPGLRFEERQSYLTQVCNADFMGVAVYKVPEMILVKTNRKYLDFLEAPFNEVQNSIGNRIENIIPNWNGSPVESYWREAIQTGQPVQVSEYMHTDYKRGATYWDSIIAPIIENERIKYVVSNTFEVTERVKNRLRDEEKNRALIQKKDELEEILENISDAVFIYDKEGNLYIQNKAARDYFPNRENKRLGDGYAVSKFYDMGGNEIPFWKMPNSRVFKGEIINQERMILKIGANTYYISVSGRPIYDSAGNIKLAVISSCDITEDVIKQQTIHEQKEELEAIIENMSDGLSVVDGKGNYIKLNKAVISHFGKKESYRIGDAYKPSRYFDGNGSEYEVDNIPSSRVLRGESLRECILNIRSENEEIFLSINGTPVFDNDGSIRLGIICSRDITEQVKQTKIIKQQKEQLETVMDNISDLLFALDANCNYLYMNKAAQKYFMPGSLKKYGDARIKTEYLDLSRNPIPEKDLPYYTVLRTKETDKRVFIMRRGENEVYLDITTTPLFDENENINMVLSCATDITEHMNQSYIMKEKNENLERAMALKDEFLSLISHEFKTPITVINSAIQAMELLCKDELSEKAMGFINKIRQNSFRQLRLVNNLLDIIRINAGQIKVHKRNFDIVLVTRAITESVKLFAQQKRISLRFKSSFKEKVIGIDDEKYERILLNLLSNAIKFTPTGKSVDVKVSKKGSMVSIEIQDEGIGIPAEKHELIFERFGQVDSSLSRQAEGSGIGLSLTKLLVQAHGAEISVNSEVGKGSKFTVLLPAKKVTEISSERRLEELTDNRLIQMTRVEFSDIYL